MCADIVELCQRFEQHGAAALLIADEVFVNAGLSQLRDTLSRQSAWSDVPMLIFTGTSVIGARPNTLKQLTELGNVTLLDRPLRPVAMLSAARTALRARRRQYDARAELLEQRRAVRQRDQFLAMLGHELRNPLSAMAMAIHLEDRCSDPARYRDIMLRQLSHLTRLVDDLLDVSRVTSGKIVLRREDLDLIALTRRCVSVLPSNVVDGITIEHVAATDSAVWIYADGVRIDQVVTNLINNAIKYTTTGGTIEIRVSVEEGQAIVQVSDTGVGIAPDMIDRIFDLFTQVEGSLDRSKGGMGIGLTLVRSLVELHGGSVEAQSPGLGGGSTFTVRLPRTTTVPLPRPMSNQMLVEASARPADEVLIIEDNEDSRELLAAILRQRGYQVFTAEDGPSGLEEALSRRPRVLLVDIGLPGIDGYGVARRVRANLGDSVYMVAVTGYGQPEDRLRATDAGFDTQLTKPIDIVALERLLASNERRAAH